MSRRPRYPWAKGAACLLLFPIASSLAGCAGTSPVPPRSVPEKVEATAQIPPDLDVVLRLDVEELVRKLPAPLIEAAFSSWSEAYGLTAFVPVIVGSEVTWVGLRPSLDRDSGVIFDYVVVVEGQGPKPTIGTENDAFYSPRDLGAAYLRYDARDDSNRKKPGRVYEVAGQRWIIASAAEVDALERVVERNHHERKLVPPAQGEISISVAVDRIVDVVGERSPRFADFLDAAEHLVGYLSVDARALELHARMRFFSQRDAERANQALRLFAQLLPSGGGSTSPSLNLQVVERDLVIVARADLALVLEWLGLL